MIRVEIELSDPDMRVFDAANWIAATLNEELSQHAVIHSIRVEEET